MVHSDFSKIHDIVTGHSHKLKENSLHNITMRCVYTHCQIGRVFKVGFALDSVELDIFIHQLNNELQSTYKFVDTKLPSVNKMKFN